MNDDSCCGSTENNKAVTREDVREFYGKAALATQESLCCPADYDPNALAHIPQEVREISYGCGSPVDRAGLKLGEFMADLGSGGGIDCFIASKIVGPEGRVFGIDMTEEMLHKATKNATRVAENLGYSNVEFKHGFLEKIPLDDGCVHLVTSNCVLNLSVSKGEVFKEIFRILRHEGRFVISDIIADKEAPEEMQNNRELWGECASGAMTLGAFIKTAREIGFHGISLQKDYLWKEIEGIKFYSYTLTAHKPRENEDSCCSDSLIAIYNGPFEHVSFGGVEFHVGTPIEVDSHVAEILSAPPYAGHFTLYDPEDEKPAGSDSCCG